MTALLILSGLVLGLSVQIGWAVWHLLNDEKPFPSSSPTVKHIDLKDAAIDQTPVPLIKETPLTPQTFFPPRYISGYNLEHSGSFISGMGCSWEMPRKLVPAHRHHFIRLG